MSANTGKIWLEKLRKRWIIASAFEVLLYSLGLSIIAGALLQYFYLAALPGFLLILLISFLLLSFTKRYWEISLTQISRFVDQKYPAVEDSSGLVLVSWEQLSSLQRLQMERVNKAILSQQLPAEPLKALRKPALFLAFSMLFLYAFTMLPKREQDTQAALTSQPQAALVVKENIPGTIEAYTVYISPPTYTGKKTRNQHQFTLVAAHGSRVRWELKTTVPVKDVRFVWNDSEVTRLTKSDKEGTSWSYATTLTKPGFYQVMLDGKRSDFYQIELIQDQPVAIKITNPAQHSTIDFGQPQQVGLNVLMTDDYGISNAYISATMSSGKGEAVSFKEQKITFTSPINNQRSLNLSQAISLGNLGMKPGDELYFYINATDNHGQQSRSDMYFVSIQDTAELMSMTGLDNGVNLVPEYFRSQRQIIIDTEKLLKERSGLADAEFKRRSNELGIDQKMLRLRYGKFLGEEEETNIGAAPEEHDDHEAGEGHEEHKEAPVAYGNVQALMDQYSHMHDQAEDATFFEPALKAQLKATLNEMWSSELHLRTYDPQKALPFEYKALRLLKDLQQKSRAYVAKTTLKTTPLKAEKRLTGELAEVQQTTAISKGNPAKNIISTLKASLALLEGRKSGQKGSVKDLRTLQLAERELINSAASAPAMYLPALKAMKKIAVHWASDTNLNTELAAAEKGINRLIGKELQTPFKSNGSPNDLTNAYFNQLKRTQR